MRQFLIIIWGTILCSCSWLSGRPTKVEAQQETIVQQLPVRTVVIDTTHSGLTLFYPNFTSIDLRCLDRPLPSIDSSIVFCCAGAYTGTGEKGHKNIAGNHVSGGKYQLGYPCKRNTGAFVYYNGKWKFLYPHNYANELDSAAVNGGCAYAQEMLIHKGELCKTARADNNKNLFRALCELDGRLCIAEATETKSFGEFKASLLMADVTEALYTDNGNGWNYSWYREYADEEATFIHPEYLDEATNWLVFYYKNEEGQSR